MLFAFDEADMLRASLDDLTAIPIQQWPDLRVRFHPSMQVFQTNWNSVQSWQALKAEKAPPTEAEDSAYWLIWRNHERITEFRSLPLDEYAMLSGFLHGHNFSHVCDALLNYHAGEEVARNVIAHLTSWLNIGVVDGFEG